MTSMMHGILLYTFARYERARARHKYCGTLRVARVTHLLFLSLVVDDPVVERKLSLSPFGFSYFQPFLQAFLQAETRSQQVSRLTRT